MSALSGLGILVTRDSKQSSELSHKLKQLEATVFEFPLIEIRAPESTSELDKAIRALDTYDWIVFASANAVEFFLLRLKTLDIPLAFLAERSLAAIGEQTGECLKSRNLPVSFIPQQFSAESFVLEFCQRHDVSQVKFLWPRTNIGKPVIQEGLEKRGASVDTVIAYETQLPAESKARAGELADLIASGALQIITLTSSQAARNLHSLLGAGTAKHNLPGIIIATIGSQTTATVAELFSCEIIESNPFTIAGLIRCISSRAERINSPRT